MRRLPVVVTVVAALALGLVAAVAANEQAPRTAVGSAAVLDPQGLVGAWRVDGAGVLEGQLLVLRPDGELRAGGEACELMGGWSATGSGLAILSIDAASRKCRDLPDAWKFFDGVQRYRLDESTAWLTDLSGAAQFTLTSAEAAQWSGSGSGEADQGAQPDEGDFSPRPEPARLPIGVTPPTIERLEAGRWLPIGTVDGDRWDYKTRPQVSFARGGSWSGYDGCNGLGGRWSIDGVTGEWLAGSGVQTEIGCDNADVAATIATARSVGLDSGELVFLDAEGHEVGRFVAEVA